MFCFCETGSLTGLELVNATSKLGVQRVSESASLHILNTEITVCDGMSSFSYVCFGARAQVLKLSWLCHLLHFTTELSSHLFLVFTQEKMRYQNPTLQSNKTQGDKCNVCMQLGYLGLTLNFFATVLKFSSSPRLA